MTGTSSAPLVASNQIGAMRQLVRRLHVPYQAHMAKRRQHPPARIPLTFFDSEARRAWEGVMIIVPCLTHSDEATTGHVVALHSSALDMPGAWTTVMGEVTDQ